MRTTSDIIELTKWTYSALNKLLGVQIPKYHLLLIMATAGMESGFKFRKQLGHGPARGLWQVEPDTAYDIFDTYLRFRYDLWKRFCIVWKGSEERFFVPSRDELGKYCEQDDVFCAMLARLKYLRDSSPIPQDIESQAKYYKRVYNTAGGKADIKHYAEVVANFSLVQICDLVVDGDPDWQP